MAHELAIVDGKASMAYVGDKPWHGLGQVLTAGADIEVWKKEAQMDWMIEESDLQFSIPGQKKLTTFDGKKVLYRGDTHAPLSVVSDQYHIVQPGEVLEFFRDLVGEGGMQLETAGCLFGGSRYWALANTNLEATIGKKDRVKGMLLLMSSCDGTLATTAKFTSVRVVCNNTLRIALGEEADKGGVVRSTHGSAFKPEMVKESLGLIDAGWKNFIGNIGQMAKTKVDDEIVKTFIRNVILNQAQLDKLAQEEALHKRVDEKIARIFNLYENGMGADMTKGTLWGAVNAVTEFIDHNTGRIADNALFNSWYGYGDNVKAKAYDTALAMI